MWDEELQDWVYDDPDLQEDLDSDSESFECEGVQWKMNGSDKLTDLRKATLPVDLLEDLSYEK